MRTFAVIPSVARPTGGAWYEGSDLARARRRRPASSRPASTSRARARERRPWDVKRRVGGAGKAPRHPAARASRTCRAEASSSRPRRRCATAASTTRLLQLRPSAPREPRLDRRRAAGLRRLERGVQGQDRRHHRRRRRHRPRALPLLRRGRRDHRGASTCSDAVIGFADELRQGGHQRGRCGRRHRRCRRRSQRAFAALPADLGDVDILINNAGVSHHPTLGAHRRRRAGRDDVNANLNGAYTCAHAVLPQMEARSTGVIVNVGSVNGLSRARRPRLQRRQGRHDLPDHARWRRNIGRYGIRANIVLPGHGAHADLGRAQGQGPERAEDSSSAGIRSAASSSRSR